MTSTTPPNSTSSWLESPAVATLRLNWEKIAWTALLLLALILRVYQLGARVMSHDESLHTTYSYNLYAGIGFKHDPLMHGPLLFHVTAVSYFLFGPSDFSARLPVALLGVGIVWLLWLARDWLGKRGAFLAATLIALSPTMVYHSRYIATIYTPSSLPWPSFCWPSVTSSVVRVNSYCGWRPCWACSTPQKKWPLST